MLRRSFVSALLLFCLCIGACGGGTAPATQPTAGALGPAGGTITTSLGSVEAAPGTLLDSVTFSFDPVVGAVVPPQGFRTLGAPVAITATPIDALNGPVLVTIPYDTAAAEGKPVLVLHEDATSTFELVTIVSHAAGSGQITVASRSFSTFVPVAAEDVPASFSVPGFDPATKGWSIANFDGRNPLGLWSWDGHCLGMSAYCASFFTTRADENLVTKFSGEVAYEVAVRAHLDANQKSAIVQYGLDVSPAHPAADVVAEVRASLSKLSQPLVMILGAYRTPGDAVPYGLHAVVAYGYTADSILIYDVNAAGTDLASKQVIPYSTGIDESVTFSSYAGYSRYGCLTGPTLWRMETVEGLTAEAEAGFLGDEHIQLEPSTSACPPDRPEESWAAIGTVPAATTSSSKIRLKGGVINMNAPTQTLICLNGDWWDAKWSSASGFDVELPLACGTNIISVLAGAPIYYQSDSLRNAATRILTVIRQSGVDDCVLDGVWDVTAPENPTHQSAAVVTLSLSTYKGVDATDASMVVTADNNAYPAKEESSAGFSHAVTLTETAKTLRFRYRIVGELGGEFSYGDPFPVTLTTYSAYFRALWWGEGASSATVLLTDRGGGGASPTDSGWTDVAVDISGLAGAVGRLEFRTVFGTYKQQFSSARGRLAPAAASGERGFTCVEGILVDSVCPP